MEVALTRRRARAIWWHKQGLGSRKPASAEEAIQSAGWAYTAGGTGPYLALLARGTGPADLNGAVFDRESLLEASSVRGAKMLVPREDVALALWASRAAHAREAEKARSAVVPDPEGHEVLRRAIFALLEPGGLTADQIRAALPPGLARPLGEEARRMGVSSTQAWALHELTSEGLVQRIYGGRRLDSKEYLFRHMGPLEPAPDTAEGVADALAMRFFTWAGPATIKEFAFFANLSQRDAKAAIGRVGLAPIAIDGEAAWILPDDAALPAEAPEPEPGIYAFLPVRDNYLYLRRGLGAFLDDGDGHRVLPGTDSPLADLSMLPYCAVVESGRLVGVWDWDPETGRVVWLLARRPERLEAFEEAVEALEACIASDLAGSIRMYAMDTPAQRSKRLAALRGLD